MPEVPENANQHCPGTSSDQAGKAAACAGCPNQSVCATAPKGPDPDLAAIAQRMSAVKNKLLVLSGKGGVGKSTVSAQLAFALARRGFEVGLLDIDICGPSVPKMLGLEGQEVHSSNLGWSPVYVEDNLAVMSIGFMLPNPDEAVIWRGPRKNGLIKQFLKDVHWGPLDFLVVDAPPGTSDEHITITQCLQWRGAAGSTAAIIVTTPQDVAVIDVRKEVSFCRKVGLPVLGVVENMAGLITPLECCTFTAAPVLALLAERFPGVLLRVGTEVFRAGGASDRMCADMGVELLGRVPLDPGLGAAADAGLPIVGPPPGGDDGAADAAAGPTAACLPALMAIVDKVVERTGGKVLTMQPQDRVA
ncbi:hypothetical protein VOLCADRAFT_107437 [Volvox carteri f. nagariensis]|uniref:Cytosolic Fe-S cluster assembly factor NBP35 n=1 Tax=Volvox carteri f. nagariensis TaxID=3068 RepID=D8UE05_VOLCA|nr:uncharacterized protein VOLCADRAFT_107437 [Volvox carteri f. nagariensis]EFJ42004.1 hypothetical protein VOLCADRAFT_107437 [Volvox carteri f. nagariensis]|eukprot:XP_002956879.1 hypothetical protein VOLCADRAFT_107437 [Volvox carteri f. nagariensis]